MHNKKNYGQNQIGDKKEELMHTTINFKYNKKPVKFDVLHNLYDHGTSIDAAFMNWSARLTDNPSLLDFCRYVEAKNPTFICHPKSRREVNS